MLLEWKVKYFKEFVCDSGKHIFCLLAFFVEGVE